ncbi:MAG: hypothetical protein FWH26_10985 [Oscillospiraceae bacterium]|nr:hypothetical protein [Oscillospiraceae bacterium]
MKKTLTAILLASLILLACAACGGAGEETEISANSSQASVPPVSTELVFVHAGTRVVMGGNPEPVLAALGKPLNSYESISCAVDARDTTYRYQGFELTVTYPSLGEPYVMGVHITDDTTAATPEGLYIGSPGEDIQRLYGPVTEDSGFYYCSKGLTRLGLHVGSDGAVDQIFYEYLFLDA